MSDSPKKQSEHDHSVPCNYAKKMRVDQTQHNDRVAEELDLLRKENKEGRREQTEQLKELFGALIETLKTSLDHQKKEVDRLSGWSKSQEKRLQRQGEKLAKATAQLEMMGDHPERLNKLENQSIKHSIRWWFFGKGLFIIGSAISILATAGHQFELFNIFQLIGLG